MRPHFTLLEICLAIAIFSIGLLTAMSVLVPTVRWGAQARSDFSVVAAAVSAMEYFNSVPAASTPNASNGLFKGISGGGGSDDVFFQYAVAFENLKADKDNPNYYEGAILKVYCKRRQDPFSDNAWGYKTGSTISSDWLVSDAEGKPIVLFSATVNLLKQL